jgi:hypothetical protein
VYDGKLRFDARFEGLRYVCLPGRPHNGRADNVVDRWFMYTHWIIAGVTFITMFIFCELASALVVWLLFASRSSSGDEDPASTDKKEEEEVSESKKLGDERKPLLGEGDGREARVRKRRAGQLEQRAGAGEGFSSRPEPGTEDIEDELSSWDDVDSAHESGASGPSVKPEDEATTLTGVSSLGSGTRRQFEANPRPESCVAFVHRKAFLVRIRGLYL